jgi:uncharacterized protein YcfL
MMQLLKLIALTAGLLIALSSFGCVPNVGPTATQRTVPQPMIDTSHPRAKLIIGSKKLLHKVAVIDPRLRAVGQLNQAEVTVQNLTDNRYTLEYKFDWEDSQGFSVNSRNVWHRFTLTPRQTQRFQSTGKIPQASAIIFTVRFPDDAFIEFYKQK